MKELYKLFKQENPSISIRGVQILVKWMKELCDFTPGVPEKCLFYMAILWRDEYPDLYTHALLHATEK